MAQNLSDPASAGVAVYVAAGSNVSPVDNLVKAIAALRRAFPDLLVSPAFANTAAGFKGADFINLVVGFRTALPLAAVLAELHAVEALCGRGRTDAKWAPRRMDLDVLLYGDLVGEFPGARLPRPDLATRAYMLGPMAAIAPDVVHPTLHKSIGELWAAFDQQAHPLRRISLAPAGARG
ncbi:MAG TPA: 2-amino-4-hydroxy-6-hydroxymethyldihydropteridine diphosphokinase [Steroidobacteraceae bacterium]|nr:2-amino-4-hydroxy-6-hydroxymethyldihydropteridine diphosphokinase [Steroidobacteraceae bacterium]